MGGQAAGGAPAAATPILPVSAIAMPAASARPAVALAAMLACAAPAPAEEAAETPSPAAGQAAPAEESAETPSPAAEPVAPGPASAQEVAAMVLLLHERLIRQPDELDPIFRLGVGILTASQQPQAPNGRPWSGDLRRNLQTEAALAFRHVLNRQPDLVQPHLFLAHALFERGDCAAPPEDLWEHLLGDDCEASERHYRRILAEEHPPQVVRQIHLFLRFIQARKRIHRSFRVAVAPDSNVNAATEARTVSTGLNLPGGQGIALNKESRQTSGVGLLLSTSAEYQRPLDYRLHERSRTLLRAGGGLYRRDYSGSTFDDMTLSLHAGPRFEFADRALNRFSILAKANRGWYGGKTYSNGRGLRAEASGWAGERTWWGGTLERMYIRHRSESGKRRDGPRLDATAQTAYIATPALTLGARGGWRRYRTDAAVERYDSWWAGLSADYELPSVFGIRGIGVSLSYDRHHRYSDHVKITESRAKRRDRLGIIRLALHNRAFALGDFTPELALVREQRKSNVELYRYQRSRIELGLRRLF